MNCFQFNSIGKLGVSCFSKRVDNVLKVNQTSGRKRSMQVLGRPSGGTVTVPLHCTWFVQLSILINFQHANNSLNFDVLYSSVFILRSCLNYVCVFTHLSLCLWITNLDRFVLMHTNIARHWWNGDWQRGVLLPASILKTILQVIIASYSK